MSSLPHFACITSHSHHRQPDCIRGETDTTFKVSQADTVIDRQEPKPRFNSFQRLAFNHYVTVSHGVVGIFFLSILDMY
jgi:hypothetical protein